jgi:hypothetical protein
MRGNLNHRICKDEFHSIWHSFVSVFLCLPWSSSLTLSQTMHTQLNRFLLKSSIYWDITLSSPLKFNWCISQTCCFQLQGWRISQARNQHEAGSKQCFMLVSCLSYSLTLKMEVICSSGTSVDFQWTTWWYVPEDRTIHSHYSENLKSYVFLLAICNWFFTSWKQNCKFSNSKAKTSNVNLLIML